MYFICHVSAQDHLFKLSCDFMDQCLLHILLSFVSLRDGVVEM